MIDTGRPYGVGGDAVEVVAEVVADAVVEEVDAAGPARPGRPMPMPLLFQCTRLVGLLVYRIGPSSLHSCDGGIVQTIPKTITLRRQN